MRGWYTLFRKEIANFFVSPIAYALIGSFLAVTGVLFSANLFFYVLNCWIASSSPMAAQKMNMTDQLVRPVVLTTGVIMLFVIPMVTMRLFSEEKKTGTMELLLTYPVSDGAIIIGKYLASLLLVLVMLAGTAPCWIAAFILGSPDAGTLLGGYIGLFLVGAAFASIGMLISSLTENQIVAAAVTFGIALLFWVMDWLVQVLGEGWAALIRELSILQHLESMNKGVMALSDISFFVLFIGFFLFLTMLSMETHRWRG